MTVTSTLPSRSGDGYIRLSGELDLAAVHECAPEAIRTAQAAQDGVTVDVRDVTFIDSAGAGLLGDILALSTIRGHPVVLLGASRQLRELLLLGGIESLFSYR